MYARFENDTFLGEKVDAALHDVFLIEFHIGNAIHQQAADAIFTLENGDIVTCLVELICASETGRAGADDSDFLASSLFRDAWDDPAFLPTLVDDRALVVLNGDGRSDDAEHAGAFAGSGADAAGELGEMIGLVQAL